MNENLPQIIEQKLPVEFNHRQRELLKTVICPGMTDDELDFFAAVCKRTGLDPFARQIHAVKRWNADAQREVITIQTAIDGFRLIAERTGKYGGQEGPFYSADGVNWTEAWVSDEPPVAAKVGVIRNDFQQTLWATARYSAYAQRKKDGTPFSNWIRMGDVMLAKCAEALALRRAFPNELSGVYSIEEMEQADSEVTAAKPPQSNAIKPPVAKPPQQKQSTGDGGLVDHDFTVTGTIQLTGEASGTKPGFIQVGGKRFSTFDKKIIDTAEILKAKQIESVVYVKKAESKGKVYENAVLVEAHKEAPAEQPEPDPAATPLF